MEKKPDPEKEQRRELHYRYKETAYQWATKDRDSTLYTRTKERFLQRLGGQHYPRASNRHEGYSFRVCRTSLVGTVVEHKQEGKERLGVSFPAISFSISISFYIYWKGNCFSDQLWVQPYPSFRATR